MRKIKGIVIIGGRTYIGTRVKGKNTIYLKKK